ncbi:PEGA domain-containing protein [Deinococcus sp. HMF7620]|uniref:PEGA domain-containing protein n=1 Tax=Deinococcus arboris TaxID=2682977 RepID=A0A7C9MRV2_9DEIO|nr:MULTISPECIES: PEGA domain-containing protein [Deinococcus]MBZ9752124.1 PEGA domain-containing protein [Deinococcus betulae]MVN87524.1 PEGA domain-containing protein [Deinococcus arboris]
MTHMNVSKSNFGNFFKATPAPVAPAPVLSAPVPVPAPIAPAAPPEPVAAPTTAVMTSPEITTTPVPVPVAAPALPPAALPAQDAAVVLTPLAVPTPPAEPEADEDEPGEDDTQEELDESPEPPALPVEEPTETPLPAAADVELPEPTGEVFGHLASLMAPGSALAFTLSLHADGQLTAQVKPLNLPALPELTLTGTVAEFDSAEFLHSLRDYRPAVQGGLRAQAQQQRTAAQKAPPAPAAAPAKPASSAATRNKGSLKITADVPDATVKGLLAGHHAPLTLGTQDLDAGKYSVEVSAPGFKTVKQTVRVERGKSAELTFTLGGRLDVQAPEGAVTTVFDAAGQPVNPAGPLPEGSYKVMVEAEGKKPYTWHGSVKGGVVTVTAALEALPPSLFT